ncbi:MAG: c-type cytochrome [Saprospiraceae bacterium]|nr:c-type cytochrome [Saprospiraceae bacterium]
MKARIFLISPYIFFSLIALILSGILASCNPDAVGFALPPGDLENGKINFVGLACTQCHSVDDLEWEGVKGQDFQLRLGGEVTKVKTYGELVTSIINPSHRIASNFKGEMPEGNSQSPMPSYNEVMTVQELVDLVTFLEKQYRLTAPTTYYYNW